MHSIDPSRLDLAEQFKRQPLGPHSQELQHILKIMRWDRADDCFLAVQPERNSSWYLARTHGPTGCALSVYLEHPIPCYERAQWEVFRARWQEHTGHYLDLGDDDRPITDSEPTSSEGLVSRPLLGYASEFSIQPGEQIEFKISSELASYHARLIKLRCADGSHLGLKFDEVAASFEGVWDGAFQPIECGSFMESNIDPIPDNLSDLAGLSLQALIWPTRTNTGPQAILGNWIESSNSGLSLYLNDNGILCLQLGDGREVLRIESTCALLERHWYLVFASLDDDSLVLGQIPLQRYGVADSTALCTAQNSLQPSRGGAFRVAAWSTRPAETNALRAPASAHFNGKIEAPRIGARAMSTTELERAQQLGALGADNASILNELWLDSDVLAHWDFSRNMNSFSVEDLSPNDCGATLFNAPTRAMRGALWDGRAFNFSECPQHYGAIHFHDDDLYDCDWKSSFNWRVPPDCSSGLYAVALAPSTPPNDASSGRKSEPIDWIPFVVRPPTGKATAKLALLLPSTSYWAYANRHGVIVFEGREQVRGQFNAADSTALYLHHHPQLGLSTYDRHSDGSGVCFSSRLRPILSLRPNEALWQLPADTHLIDWLEESGIAYDVLTEDDLHTEGPQLLDPYTCVMTGTHPEYPSKQVLDGIERLKARGGRFMYMGGNGFYWRVSFDKRYPGLMEMRRGEDGIRAWLAEGGEYYHALTGELGGMWRRMGRAPQSVAGAGMTAQGFDRSTFYSRTPQSFDPRARFIFTGIEDDEPIGDFGILGGGAAGWEVDRADFDLGTPPHALIVATATDFSSSYHWMKEELTHTHDAITGENCPLVRADMVFFETPGGGAVFSTSSIAWAAALHHNGYDNNVSRITKNVVTRFLDPTPF